MQKDWSRKRRDTKKTSWEHVAIAKGSSSWVFHYSASGGDTVKGTILKSIEIELMTFGNES